MARTTSRKRSLSERFPPSEPCTCTVCVAYCARPGWWTVEEASCALEAGYGGRMMLEMAPDFSFGVLAPASAAMKGILPVRHSQGMAALS